LNPSSSAPTSSCDPSSSAPASSLNPFSSAPASSLNHASSPSLCSPLESVVGATSSLKDATTASSYSLHSGMTPQIGCGTIFVSLEEIRPLTKVNQNIPLAKRPWANNSAGSTSILTDTPEKMKIDEENRRKEKDIKKKERERKNLAPKNIFKPAEKKNIEKKAKKSKRNENEEETINVNEEDDENCNNTQEQTVTQITRTGRIVKKKSNY
jgi:hypothetical protein